MSELIARAEEFARLIHRDQKYGTLPYISHLKDIYSTLKNQFRVSDEVILASAWLLSSLEETETTYETLETQFGKEVVGIVQAVTTPNTCQDIDRAISYLLSNKKALIVKLVDRIITTEWVIEYREDNKGRDYECYEESFLYFSGTLRDKNETDFTILYIWEYLEALYNQEEKFTLEELQVRAKKKQQENQAKNPWIRLASKYENDEQYKEVLEAIKQDRKELEKIEEAIRFAEKDEKDDRLCDWSKHKYEYQKELNELEKENDYWEEREAEYYDNCYQIVEEKLYDL